MTLRLENIERLHLGMLVLACVVAHLTRLASAPSVLLGGAVMGLNFWIMRQLFRRVASGDRERASAAVVGLALAKFTLFMALLGLLFWRVPLDALGFGAGATLLLVACVVETLRPGAQTA